MDNVPGPNEVPEEVTVTVVTDWTLLKSFAPSADWIKPPIAVESGTVETVVVTVAPMPGVLVFVLLQTSVEPAKFDPRPPNEMGPLVNEPVPMETGVVTDTPPFPATGA